MSGRKGIGYFSLILTYYVSRVVYLSMFEISSERGKGEKMIDLLHDGGDVSLQHSVIKGLREVIYGELFLTILQLSSTSSYCSS